jgi:xanthine dehydrogenase YagS FAD-binding subunit
LLGKSWGETEVLAGGTDLLTSLKQELTHPKRVVSLTKISGLKGIQASGDTVTIGAMTTLADFIANGDIRKNFPALVTAAENIGGSQIINMGTIGGDLLQRPRCWYYRQGFGLFGTKDGKALVPAGDNRYHAIFMNDGPAQFVNPSSLAPGLIALDASLTVAGGSGERNVSAAGFFTVPKNESDREYALKPNEVLTAITIPLKGLKNATYEIRQRRGLDWPMVTASVAYAVEGGKAADARVVLGHVAPVPYLSEKAASALNGTNPADADEMKKVGAAAAEGATPLSQNAYKIQQVKVAVRRAIAAASA